MPESAYGKRLLVQRSKGAMHLGAHHRLAKQAHQVVSQHGKTLCRFGGIETVQVEGIQDKVGFAFLDAVLAVGAAPVGTPYLQCVK